MSSHEREVIGVDDRVSVGRAIPLGIQHMMSMFGSTVLVPVLTGLDPNVAIMCSGIGTICYLLVTGNKIPSYLGSSFAFISPILAVGATQGLDAAMSGVIVSAGAQPRKAGFVGEERYAGHGVSYCATCDGMFYRGKQVFVIGGGNSAAEEALFLTRFASKVTVVVRKDHLRAQASVVSELERSEKVELLLMTSIVEVGGGELPSSITFRDNATGETRVETYEEGSFGVFVLVGRVPESGLLRGLVELDESGYAVTDERMATTTPGLFVAGDVRRKPLRQIVTAASDGAVAATSVAAYLGHPVEG